jgi:type III restriction enzyme
MRKASRCSKRGVAPPATISSRARAGHRCLCSRKSSPLELVNTIRERVKAWRERGYPGVTPITRQLLQHWNNPERERKLFFCQRETVETLNLAGGSLPSAWR